MNSLKFMKVTRRQKRLKSAIKTADKQYIWLQFSSNKWLKSCPKVAQNGQKAEVQRDNQQSAKCLQIS